MGAFFTMRLKDVIEELYNPSFNSEDWVQPYGEFKFNGTVYGRLPYLDDYTPLGLGTYPIFDETYRAILNGKIIDEYFNREIGVETIDMFVANVRKHMDQIMPYYNQMYESTLIEYNALDNMNIRSIGKTKIDGTENVEGEGTGKTTNQSGARAVSSNFPQTMLAGNSDYATSGNDTNANASIDSESTQKSKSNSLTNNDSDTQVTGYQGAASDLITKFRASLINVDMMILSSMDENFMQLFGTGESFYGTRPYGWW